MAPRARRNYLSGPAAEIDCDTEDVFPTFADGDVKIIISGARQYHLHRNVLVRKSAVFARLLSEDNAANLSTKAIQKGVRFRWRLHAVVLGDGDDGEHGPGLVLKQIALDHLGRPINHVYVPLDLENGRVVDPVYYAYNSVFRACYGLPIEEEWEDVEDLDGILRKVGYILAVARYLEATHVVGKPIEALLLSTGQALYQKIYRNPPGYLDLALIIESKTIFKEALIHAVGQYNTPLMKEAMQQGNGMNPAVYEIVEKKARLLLDAVKNVQMNMLSYYPQNMQRQVTVGLRDIDHIGRNSYGNDIMCWIALTAFRHWLSQSMADDQTHHANDMGYAFLRMVAKGKDEYLNTETMSEFHRFIPMTEKGRGIVANKILELKTYVTGFVGQLLEVNTALDQKERRFFTCIEVDLSDYPWRSRTHAADPEEESEDGEDVLAAEESEGELDDGDETADKEVAPSSGGMFVTP